MGPVFNFTDRTNRLRRVSSAPRWRPSVSLTNVPPRTAALSSSINFVRESIAISPLDTTYARPGQLTLGPGCGSVSPTCSLKGHAQLARIIWALGDGGTPWGPTPVLMRVWELRAQALRATGRAN